MNKLKDEKIGKAKSGKEKRNNFGK